MSVDKRNLAAKHSGGMAVKKRSASEAAAYAALDGGGLSSPTAVEIISGEIYSFKLRKGQDGSVFAAYCVHVGLSNGLKWIVERRYSQFRQLKREIALVKPELRDLPFPTKRWLFNLSKSALASRMSALNHYLHELLGVRPPIQELKVFLEVGIRLAPNSDMRSMNRSQSISSLKEVASVQDFRVLKVLGKGSFGKVFLVRPADSTRQEAFAMKVLSKAEVVRRQQVEHTLTERRILQTVEHPFVLQLHYAFQTNQRLYMVVDYCCGGELFFHLKRMRRFTEGMVRFYCGQIATALAYLHSNRIMYRDLKPENILLDQRGFVKLTDFGLSRYVNSPTPNAPSQERRELTFCGTPEYLSPEMILHRKSFAGYSYEVDWWSLGIVCFELLTGLPPFYDRDFNKMCEKILYRPLTFPTQKLNLTRGAEDLVRCLLQRDPSKRIRYELNLSEDSDNAAMPTLNRHPFFLEFDWTRLLERSMDPPFVPNKPRDMTDTCNFERDFTCLSIGDSHMTDSAACITLEEQRAFEQFSFAR